jgi:hypothetical protein
MTLSRVVCVITTIFSWLGIRSLPFASRGRTAGADSDNLPRFFLTMGFRGPNLLRAAVTGERP